MENPIRIFLVEDHNLVRLGLHALLDNEPDLKIVGEAATLAFARTWLQNNATDVVLLDVRLTDGLGFELLPEINRLSPPPKVILLTSVLDDRTVADAIRLGVDGYLLKNANSDLMMNHIRKIFEGESIMDPLVIKRLFSRGTTIQQSAEILKRSDLLAPQELRVMEQVAEGKTNREIAAILSLSDKTVKNYLANAMEKLQLSRRSQIAAFYIQYIAKP
jgi:DNA-binding NarL/FixJ family response regulator